MTTLEAGMGDRVGGRFKREGIYVYLYLICIAVWQKPAQHCKPIIFQLKKKRKKKTHIGLKKKSKSNNCLSVLKAI